MNFIQLSRTNKTADVFYINVANIVKFGSAVNSNTTLIYYTDGTNETVLETEEEIINLIKESTSKIIAQAQKIA